MPGFLSQMFDGDQQSDDQQHLGIDHATDVDQSVGIHTEMGGSYQDADGTTHSWSSSHDVGADVGVHAVTVVAVDTAEHLGGDLA